MHTQFIFITIISLLATPLHTAELHIPKAVYRQPPALPIKQIETGIYLPELFWQKTDNATTVPLLAGPASPCIIVFAATPGSSRVFGAHVNIITNIPSIVSSIDACYNVADTEKPALTVALFTRTNETEYANKNFIEGSHRNRFDAIYNALASRYTIIKSSLYFNKTTDGRNFIQDRWVICSGLKEDNTFIVNSFCPFSSLSLLGDYRVDSYIFEALKNRFGLSRLTSIGSDSLWNSSDEPLQKLDHTENVTLINQLHPASQDPFITLFATIDRLIALQKKV